MTKKEIKNLIEIAGPNIVYIDDDLNCVDDDHEQTEDINPVLIQLCSEKRKTFISLTYLSDKYGVSNHQYLLCVDPYSECVYLSRLQNGKMWVHPLLKNDDSIYQIDGISQLSGIMYGLMEYILVDNIPIEDLDLVKLKVDQE
jgi:hypothetical protein